MTGRKTAILTFALAGLLVGAVGAGAQDAYTESDRNRDGVVDRREFQQRMVDVFYAMDTDRSGALSPTELSMQPGKLRGADKNGDGQLQMHEFLDARAADFDVADENGDGVLSAAELRAAR